MKTISIFLVVSLIFYPTSDTLASPEKHTLAAQSRIDKYTKANEISIDTFNFTIALASMRKAILKFYDGDLGDNELIDAIEGCNKNLERAGTNIRFDTEEIYEVELKKTKARAICIKVIFPKGEERWIYFTKGINLEDRVLVEFLSKIGINPKDKKNYPEDIDYLLNGPLAEIWISKAGPQKAEPQEVELGSRVKRALVTGAYTVVLVALALIYGCTPDFPDTTKLTFLDVPYIQDIATPELPPEEDITKTADGTSGEISPAEITEPDVIEPEPDVVEPLPDTAEPKPEVIEVDAAEPMPDVAEPKPEVIEPIPDVAEPTPDVPEPTPDVPEPTPDVVEPIPDVAEPTPDVPDVAEPTPEIVEPMDIAEDELGLEEVVEVVDIIGPEEIGDAEICEVTDAFPDEFPGDQPEISEDIPGDEGEIQPDIVEPPYIEIPAFLDLTNNPVTLLPSDTSLVVNGDSSRYGDENFVRQNNAAYKYNAPSWSWSLTPELSQQIYTSGISYIYNGREHNLILTCIDSFGETITITIKPEIEDVIDYTQPYRAVIEPAVIQDKLSLLGINPDDIVEISIENLEPDSPFLFNGFRRLYAVLATPGEVIPDMISPKWETFHSPGSTIEASINAEGKLTIKYTKAADNSGSGGVKIWTKAGLDPADPNCQGYWNMNGADLGTDSGANTDNTMVNENGVVPAPGKYGNAAEFNAAQQSHFVIPPEAQTNLDIPGNLTIGAWVQIYDFNTNCEIVRRFNGYSLEVNRKDLDNDGFRELVFREPGKGYKCSYPFVTDQWYHVAAVREDGVCTLYINGEPQDTIEAPELSLPAQEGDLFLVGWNGKLQYTNGKIDDLVIYDRVLTPEEIEEMFKYQQTDSSNFLTPELAFTDFNAMGDTSFVLRLFDKAGQVLEIFVLGLDLDSLKGITIDINDGDLLFMNPFFNLSKVEPYVQILFEDPDLQTEEVNLATDGLIGELSGTRGEYAHDPDLTPKEAAILESKLPSQEAMVPFQPVHGYKVFGITSWPDILTPDGLNFQIGNRKFSAFHIGKTIYVPAPDMIINKILIDTEQLRKALSRRNHIISEHEAHEIKGWGHKRAVLYEYDKYNINGLNYADIVTVLLGVLIRNEISNIDRNFHKLFIAELLTQGMPLDIDTYSEILRQTLKVNIAPKDYTAIIKEHKGSVRTYLGEKVIYTEGIRIDLDKEEVQDEPGYREFEEALQIQHEQGTIPIDLARFFIENDTLSDAVTVDTEYFKRFIYFARRLSSSNITLIGITAESEEDIAIKQLVGLIQQHLPGFQIHYNIDFNNYQTVLQGKAIDTEHTVSILSEESVRKIENPEDLKIIAPFLSDYNRVVTTWQEFRVAVDGINKDKGAFMKLIIEIARELLQGLVERNQITQEIADKLIGEIDENGIGYIPVHYDPIHYNRSIERMKDLLIHA